MGWLEYFRKWASKYDREVEAYGYQPGKLFKPFVPLIGRRKRCLDVGCGTGKSLEVVAELCDEVVGVEPVEKMARRAQARGEGFRVERLKGREIGQLEGQFDLITCFASIDYMHEVQTAKAAASKLAPGGMVFLTVEPENEDRVRAAFKRVGFDVVKRLVKKAYEGQKYVCLLMEKTVK